MTLQNSIYAPTPFAIAKGGTGNSAALTNGQLWVGNTGNSPTPAALTPGSGIAITNGAGTITITNTAASAVVLADPTLSVTLQGNTTYIANNNTGAVTVFTLPASPTPGEFYQIIGMGGIGWQVAQNAGQRIRIATTNTTTGTGGSLNSATIGLMTNDSVIIWCMTSTEFAGVILSGTLNIT